MKKAIAVVLVIAALFCALFCGCAPRYEKSPAEYEGIRWITYDYSFCIKPAEDCAGFYRFNDTKYNIKVSFDSSRLTAVDTDNSNKELFNADWLYETNDSGDKTLYIYNIAFNTADYEALKTNYAEFVTLKQEKL